MYNVVRGCEIVPERLQCGCLVGQQGRLEISDTLPPTTANQCKDNFPMPSISALLPLVFFFFFFFLCFFFSLRIQCDWRRGRRNFRFRTPAIYIRTQNLLRHAYIFNDFTDAQNLLRGRWVFQKYPAIHQYFSFLGYCTEQFSVLSHELRSKANDFVFQRSVRIILKCTTKFSTFDSLS